MIRMICDICNKPSQCWEFKRKFHVFKRECIIAGELIKTDFDVCDSCIREIVRKVKDTTN